MHIDHNLILYTQLDVAMFGKTTKIWCEEYFGLKGYMRDYASINKLICFSNMENLNAVLINQSISWDERLIKFNQIAIR